MMVDGRALADSIAEEITHSIASCDVVPVLGIMAIAPTKETESFIRIKKKRAQSLGISVREEIHDILTQDEAEHLLKSLVGECHGVVLQQPLPSSLDADALLSWIPPEKDIDALREDSLFISPVVAAVSSIFRAHDITVRGAQVVVVGSGKLVGMPVATHLRAHGAEVKIFDKETGINAGMMKSADIIVSGVGEVGIITPEMVGPHTVLIDAGTSGSKGTVQGDVDPRCYELARLVSPVPGGLGPVTVVELFKNLIKSASCSL